jgi:glycosyltransferase involved in cell wall biosynthesis
MAPLVSVLIPCFNAERLIGEAIESALAQSGPAIEVIVVDDGSTDGSPDVIRRFDGRIRWETGPNRGGGGARNRLLELASGEWLQYLDADDYLRPGKIAGQIAFARQHPDVDIVVSPTVWEKTGNGGLVWVENSFRFPCDPWVMLARWHLPQTGGPLFRKSALVRVGGWKIGQPCCQEHELYGRLLQAGCRFEFFNECLAVYRDWDHSVRLTQKFAGEVDRQRLAIISRMEDFLLQSGGLTAPRRQAINDARLEIARKIWVRDHDRAGNRAVGRGLPSHVERRQPFRLSGSFRAARICWCTAHRGRHAQNRLARLRLR